MLLQFHQCGVEEALLLVFCGRLSIIFIVYIKNTLTFRCVYPRYKSFESQTLSLRNKSVFRFSLLQYKSSQQPLHTSSCCVTVQKDHELVKYHQAQLFMSVKLQTTVPCSLSTVRLLWFLRDIKPGLLGMPSLRVTPEERSEYGHLSIPTSPCLHHRL